jgi:anti-anti-sigma regulatory factor
VYGGDLVLDLSGVSFIDAGGVRFLLRTNDALSREGRRLVPIVESPHIRRLLTLLDVHGRLEVRSTWS